MSPSFATPCPAPIADRRVCGWCGVAAIVTACVLVELLGGLVAAPAVRTWHPTLLKAGLTPPGWVFGAVWPCLYAGMAVAAAVVWAAREREDVSEAMALFFLQLAAHLAWSVFFLGLHTPLLGIMALIAVWSAVGATTVEFFRVNRWAGVLMLPCWVWVTVAGFLHATTQVAG